MTAPGDEADRGLEANLGSISDEQWLAGHRQLAASGDIPTEELSYYYDPERDPSTVSVEDLTPDRDWLEPDEVSTDG